MSTPCPDCGQPAQKRGFCLRDYMRHRRAGTLPPRPPKPPCPVCGEPGTRKGFCQFHYDRQRAGRDPAVTPVRSLPDEKRFWSKVDKSAGPDACWPWLAGQNGEGYGAFYLDGHHLLAHRVAWEYTHGPIPEFLTIDHVKARGCTMRKCCNPAHLEPVGLGENVRRAQLGHAPYWPAGEQAARARRRLTARFWGKVKCGELDECWPWLGYVDPAGAARFWRDDASVIAQRVAYELAGGEPAPPELVVENSCDTPHCMNPEHLRAVPRALSRSNTQPARREQRSAAGKKGMAVRWAGHRDPATTLPDLTGSCQLRRRTRGR